MAPAETELILYSSWFCPFAQRTWITCEEKQLPYKLVEVNPYSKPANLVKANPRSLVPAIDYRGEGLGESLIINEYLDDAFPESRRLLPEDPLQKAKCKVFVDGVITKQLTPLFYKIMKARGNERKDSIEQCKEVIKEIVTQLEQSDGSYLFGNEFGFADIALAPFIPIRNDILESYTEYDPVKESGSKKFEEWCELVMKKDSVRTTLADKDKLFETYKRYADGTATSKVAEAVKSGLPLP